MCYYVDVNPRTKIYRRIYFTLSSLMGDSADKATFGKVCWVNQDRPFKLLNIKI